MAQVNLYNIISKLVDQIKEPKYRRPKIDGKDRIQINNHSKWISKSRKVQEIMEIWKIYIGAQTIQAAVEVGTALVALMGWPLAQIMSIRIAKCWVRCVHRMCRCLRTTSPYQTSASFHRVWPTQALWEQVWCLEQWVEHRNATREAWRMPPNSHQWPELEATTPAWTPILATQPWRHAKASANAARIEQSPTELLLRFHTKW